SDTEEDSGQPEPKRQKLDHNAAQSMYETVKSSESKAVIIKADPDGTSGTTNWYVAVIDWDETCETKAIQEGIYRLRWYLPHHQDSKKRRRKDCRFWPEVHELTRNGELGCIRPISPHKATKEYLKQRKWVFYEWDVDLRSDLLVGPFNFETINGEPFRIPKSVWNKLANMKTVPDLNVSDMNRVIPLK
ncbi:MAG TPA: hypothetical protein VLS45_00540, partial [Methylomicrobium sp.]|nr:hypothetical protein [Methylomicrobium sp.]